MSMRGYGAAGAIGALFRAVFLFFFFLAYFLGMFFSGLISSFGQYFPLPKYVIAVNGGNGKREVSFLQTIIVSLAAFKPS